MHTGGNTPVWSCPQRWAEWRSNAAWPCPTALCTVLSGSPGLRGLEGTRWVELLFRYCLTGNPKFVFLNVNTPYLIWIENTYTSEFTFNVSDLVKRLHMLIIYWYIMTYSMISCSHKHHASQRVFTQWVTNRFWRAVSHSAYCSLCSSPPSPTPYNTYPVPALLDYSSSPSQSPCTPLR